VQTCTSDFSELINVCSTDWFVIPLPYFKLQVSLITSNPKFVRPLKILTIGYHKVYRPTISRNCNRMDDTSFTLDCATFQR